eukprot:jgi/Mesvir1/9055/Mv21332-RA.1
MSAQDPFHVVRDDVSAAVTKLMAKFDRWQKMGPRLEKAVLGSELEKDLETVSWEVEELEKAISVAEKDMARFNVNQAEINRRRDWTKTTRSRLAAVQRTLLAAAATPASGGSGSGIIGKGKTASDFVAGPSATEMKMRARMEENERYVASEREKQQSLLKQQDEDLDDLSESITKIHHVGLTINEELKSQEVLLDEFGSDLQGASNRLEAAQRKMQQVLQKSGQKVQIALIILLMVILALLVGFTFS